MPTYDIVYSKLLRLAAVTALCAKLLLQLAAVIVFKESLPLFSIAVMVLEAAAAFVLYRGERSFITALPFLLIAVLENVLFFCTIDLPASSGLHLVSLILIAIVFLLSMAGRMYENRTKLMFIFVLLVAAWAFDLFVTYKAIADTPLDLAIIRVRFVLPVAYGLAAAWASFPRYRHHLTEEEVEERLEQNKTMLTTGMISVKEYKNTMNMLLKCGEKK